MSAPTVPAVDFMGDADLDRVGEITAELGRRVREEDPQKLYEQLAALCAQHPAKAAQMLMTFAAWFDPFQHSDVLAARARGAAGLRGRSVGAS